MPSDTLPMDVSLDFCDLLSLLFETLWALKVTAFAQVASLRSSAPSIGIDFSGLGLGEIPTSAEEDDAGPLRGFCCVYFWLLYISSWHFS